MNDSKKGIIITLLCIGCMSPDTLFFRFLGLLNINVWDILFWRGILVAIGVLLFSKIIRLPIIDTLYKGGKNGFFIILFDTLSNICFYFALSLTTAANTLVILSAVPIFSAALGKFILGDSVKIRTWIAIGITLPSIIFLTSGSQQSGNFIGDLFALGAAISIAASLIALRSCRSLDMTPCVGIANLATSLVVLPLANPILIFNGSSSIILLLLMGIFSTLALIFLAISPRYINAAEVSVFFPLETVLGSFLVWYFIGETVKSQTLIGGAIILCTIVLYSWYEFRDSRKSALLAFGSSISTKKCAMK